MASSSSPLSPGDVVGGVWRIGERIGQGTYSEIYEAYCITKGGSASPDASDDGHKTCIRAAAKIDHPDPRPGGLEWESNLLLKLQKYSFVPRHYGFYTAADGKTKVLLMQLLGNNISTIRRRQSDEAIHTEGYIHRDLKPSNFVHGVGRLGRAQIYVLDFGQSRMYLDDKGAVRPPRDKAGFRGTSLYSSLNAHHYKDLGRRDDLWSLFYGFIDMVRGGLPWRPHKDDRKKCEIAKQYYYERPEELVHGLPGSAHLLRIQLQLQALTFEDKPDYGEIASCFIRALDAARAEGIEVGKTYPPYPPNEALLALWTQHTMANTKGHEEGEVPVVTLAHGTGIPHDSSEPSADDVELMKLLDNVHIPYSCDTALESRGGQWGNWELDSAGIPVYTALYVDNNGRPVKQASQVMENLRAELAACRRIAAQGDDSAASPIESDSEEEEGHATADVGVSSVSASEAFVSGRKRRRPDDFDYSALSDGEIVKGLNGRVDEWYALLADTPTIESEKNALREAASSLSAIIDVGVKAFAKCLSADTVREDISQVMKRLLRATSAAEVSAAATGTASLLHRSSRLLLLPGIAPAEHRKIALSVGRLESWLAACGSKPPPLTALTSLQGFSEASTTGTDERKLRREARRRAVTLRRLLAALERERELGRALPGDPMKLSALARLGEAAAARRSQPPPPSLSSAGGSFLPWGGPVPPAIVALFDSYIVQQSSSIPSAPERGLAAIRSVSNPIPTAVSHDDKDMEVE